MKRPSFSGQFLIFSLVVLVAGMVAIGLWVQKEIRHAVTNRTAAVTALYVNSVVLPHVAELEDGPRLNRGAINALGDLLAGTGLGRDIVSFKIWASDGTILYSPQERLIGRNFGTHRDLAEAFDGGVVSHVSSLEHAENAYERQFWDTLIETYAPVRLEGSGRIVAVAEFYQLPDALLADIRGAQIRSWLVVGAATLVMYFLLVGMVHRASNVIETQRSELSGNVTRLRDLLTQNRKLQKRMRAAAGRTTALNEKYLHRISADLHDGPAQSVALALLRVEGLATAVNGGPPPPDGLKDLSTVKTALDSALMDIRVIAEGLQLPEVEHLAPVDTARRVVKDFERVTGKSVRFQHEGLPSSTPLPVTITVYRVLQEALANSYKHGAGATQTVILTATSDELCLEISDDGPGFDAAAVSGDGALGLVGMRERVEMLGGRFDVQSSDGTVVHACLPLADQGAEEDD